MSWSDLPVMETSDPCGIDGWFVSFEVKLKAVRVDPSRWAERFEECPRVPQEVKSRLPADALTDYTLARKWVLREYGPIDPVGTFRAKLYGVKGEGRDKVRKELRELLVLYNRAATDFGGPIFTQRDLIHPFVQAFPDEIRQSLMKDLAFAFTHDDPFEQIYHRAPEFLPDRVTMLSRMQDNKERPQKRFRPTFDRPRGTCPGCGGSCPDRRSCPAQGRVCNNCQALHHFASVCRKPRMHQSRMPDNDRSQYPFRQGPANPPPQ